MRAVVFKGPWKIVVEDRPVPKIEKPTDVILKVSKTALCGSDLHYYRGHGVPRRLDFICGHEIVGYISELGADVKNFMVGDHVVLPFHTACAECYYCKRGESSRCSKCEQFGDGVEGCIDGGQSEYIRVPQAATTLVHAPQAVPEEVLVLMADIFPTGYLAASRFLKDLPEQLLEDMTVAVIGCGPVGICALTCAMYLTGGRGKFFAIDSVSKRLKEAERIGATPLALSDDPVRTIQAATDGRGADVVLEIVGHSDALQLALDIIRPWGKVSSVGVHGSQLSISGPQLHAKNATLAFGCCPVRSLFEDALAVLAATQDKVKFLCGSVMPLESAPEAFALFEQRKVHKVIFAP
ncbi:s-(hydroxymethyl)glutathione dehydrogenase [Fusarium pseudocircinatum]|uniref:S-(Hydroxymethyl)glutathione dehydrogenase n=1 Tax=Fusarium pseudocircinatum TaxID=56676 RepID=A0A8H5KF83_9HYPO|nr:s-(hydroxymethyl)glutathione dehydrogenase [Fusarium pseudocircinatum]